MRGFRWNGEMKRLAAKLFLFAATGLILANIGIGLYQNRMRREHTRFAGAVLEQVLASYPDVSEAALIGLLDGEYPAEWGQDRLARYGVFPEWGSSTFNAQERELRRLQAGCNLFFVILSAVGIAGLFAWQQKRQEQIAKVQNYMEGLERGVYCLELEDNADDELSGLRNEIYRLTVMMKEQADLARSQRMALADSVANISHQLKTPLTSATVLADNLAEDENMDPEVRHQFLSQILRQLTGMSWLITAMLKVSRLEAGVVELNRQKVLVRTLVERCVQGLETLAEWKDVSLELQLQEDAFLNVDESWTIEALGNIVKNAIEHSPAGGKVEISALENEVYTEICVCDSGVGISKKERQMLFRRFYRGTAPMEDSVGIGLALSKEVVERQNGHITVESEEGRCTVFHIKFMKCIQ